MFHAQPPVRRNLHAQMVEALAGQIVSGQVAPGELLPNEDVMGRRFGVSRTVVREAVKVLASKGLLEVRTKVGARVRPPRDWALADPDLLAWKLEAGADPAFLAEVLAVRRLLEPSAAAAAAQAPASARQAVKRALATLDAAEGEETESAREGLIEAIRAAADNRVLGAMSRTLASALPSVGEELPLAACRKVAEAIAAGKPAEARKAMERLVAASEEPIAKAVAKRQRAQRRTL